MTRIYSDENGWRETAVATFDCELCANADIMEVVLVWAQPYFLANSLSGNICPNSAPA